MATAKDLPSYNRRAIGLKLTRDGRGRGAPVRDIDEEAGYTQLGSLMCRRSRTGILRHISWLQAE